VYLKREEIMSKDYFYGLAFLSVCLIADVQAMHRPLPAYPSYEWKDPELNMSKKDMLFKCPDSIYKLGPQGLKIMRQEGRSTSIYDICLACLGRAKMEKEEMEQIDKVRNRSLTHKPRFGESESNKRAMHEFDKNIEAWKEVCPQVMVG
jgi:hypothetical protein